MRTDNGTEYVNDEFGKKNQKKEYFNNFVLWYFSTEWSSQKEESSFTGGN
jgi:hypothetical protein